MDNFVLKMRSLRGPNKDFMRSSGVHPFDHVLITKGSALKNEKQLREAKEDFHLLGDAIESLKKDVHRLKNKTVSYLSEDIKWKTGRWSWSGARPRQRAFLGPCTRFFRALHLQY